MLIQFAAGGDRTCGLDRMGVSGDGEPAEICRHDGLMPARNIYHDAVVRALQADGWTITHDPLTISYGGRDLFVDLGAERSTLAAERGEQRIAVEIQSFLSPSPIRDLEEA